MPEKQYRNTITNLEPDVPRPEAASDNNVIHTPQAAELIERGLPELEAAELGLPELATRPEPASPPVAAKGGRGEAKTDAGAGARERRGEGAERGTPPPPPAGARALFRVAFFRIDLFRFLGRPPPRSARQGRPRRCTTTTPASASRPSSTASQTPTTPGARRRGRPECRPLSHVARTPRRTRRHSAERRCHRRLHPRRPRRPSRFRRCSAGLPCQTSPRASTRERRAESRAVVLAFTSSAPAAVAEASQRDGRG